MTSTQATKSTFTTRTNPALAAAAAATSDIKYRILYLKLHGVAATTRAMLAISGVEWESIYPTVMRKLEQTGIPTYVRRTKQW